MGKPVIGEVVVLPFPQTNLQSGKRRPALVVADLVGDDLVLCQITRKPRSDGCSIPVVLAYFERGRLAVDSFIRSNRLFSVEQSASAGTMRSELNAKGKVKTAEIERGRSAACGVPDSVAREGWQVLPHPLRLCAFASLR